MIISLLRFDLQKVFGDSMEDNNATKLFQISLILVFFSFFFMIFTNQNRNVGSCDGVQW